MVLYCMCVCLMYCTVANTSRYRWRLGSNGAVSWTSYIQIFTCRAWRPLLSAGIAIFLSYMLTRSVVLVVCYGCDCSSSSSTCCL